MKYLILPITALLLYACGNGNRKQNSEATIAEIENTSMGFGTIEQSEQIISNRDAEEKALIDKERTQSLFFSSEPYKTVKEIDDELYRLLSDCQDEWEWECLEVKNAVFFQRLEFHLANQLTFNNKLPRTNSIMKIISTPDRKYKFYSFDYGGDGTMRSYDTYIQYLDDSGKTTFHKWQDKVRFDYSKLYITLWQFQHQGTTYYVAKSFKQGSSRSYYYYMEIFSLTDGQPTYHTNFYPKGVYEPHEYKMVDLSLGEPEYYAPAYDVCVCYTDFGNKIDYSFDPKTKTVNITEYDESLGESVSKKINSSWQLFKYRVT